MRTLKQITQDIRNPDAISHKELYYALLVFAKIAYVNELALMDLATETKIAHVSPASKGKLIITKAKVHHGEAYMRLQEALERGPDEWWGEFGDFVPQSGTVGDFVVRGRDEEEE